MDALSLSTVVSGLSDVRSSRCENAAFWESAAAMMVCHGICVAVRGGIDGGWVRGKGDVVVQRV